MILVRNDLVCRVGSTAPKEFTNVREKDAILATAFVDQPWLIEKLGLGAVAVFAHRP